MYFITGAILTAILLGLIRFFNMFETVDAETRTGVTALVLSTVIFWPMYLIVFGIFLAIGLFSIAAEYIGEKL